MIVDTIELLVCTDCALIIANDDDSGAPDGHRERMRLPEGGRTVITCLNGQGGDDDFAHRDFSRTPCDVCGTDGAGDRCPAATLIEG